MHASAVPPVKSLRLPRHRQRGFSLMELLVAMALAWLVIAAMLGLDMATSRAGRLLLAQAQMDEDAQIGLQLLAADVMQAGYAAPVTVSTQSDANGQRRFTRTFDRSPVFGCAKGFVSASAALNVVCASSGTSAGLEVRYEADLFNTVGTVSANLPGDCLGNGIKPDSDMPTTSVAYNRYFVDASSGRSELKCASRANGGQPLVENVDKLQVGYGVAAPTNPRQLVRYVTADAVSDFALVVSVRLCLLMRSQDAVLSAEEALSYTYVDCDQVSRTSPDKRLRRAYVTSVALRNKMPL